jgi:large subunit ribosomal protein L35
LAPAGQACYAPRFFRAGPAKRHAVAALDAAFPQGSEKESEMPKLKTKSGVKKRFKLTATGKVKCGVAGKRHRLISHNGKYIRQNRGTTVLAKADGDRVKLWIPYGLD